MSVLKYSVFVLLFGSVTALAAPVSEATMRELLAVTQAQKLVEGMKSQMHAHMDQSVRLALQGTTPTAGQQRAIERMKNRMMLLMQNELAWEKIEPMYLTLYAESFSEEEVAGMLEFYKTPAGQAVINKMPLLMQKSVLEVQKIMMRSGPQMQRIRDEFMAELGCGAKTGAEARSNQSGECAVK